MTSTAPEEEEKEEDTIGPVPTKSLSTREFGVELECIMRWNAEVEQQELYNQFGKRLRAFGIHALAPDEPNEYYRYEQGYVVKRTKWFLDGDSSVGVEPQDFRYSRERRLYPHLSSSTWEELWHGAEYVSPILNENRWEEVQLVMQLIKSRPFAVYHNTTCSTHIHVGIQDASEDKISNEDALIDLQKLGAVWYLFEIFFSFHFPESRVNPFCKRTYRTPWAKRSGPDDFLNDIGEAASLEILCNLMNNTKASGGPTPGKADFTNSRYFGANFCNITSKRKWTVEFRSMEGVKDFDTVQTWGKLLMRLFDQAVRLKWADIDGIAEQVLALGGPTDEGFFGSEEVRDTNHWMRWLTMMHPLFILLLSSTEALLKLGVNMDAPDALVHLLDTWVMEDGMSREQADDADYQKVYAELLLLKRISNWLVQRRNKYFSQFEDFFVDDNWLEWGSDRHRFPRDEDYLNHANPSGIVPDANGMDIRINQRRELQNQRDWARFPSIFQADPGEEEIPIPLPSDASDSEPDVPPRPPQERSGGVLDLLRIAARSQGLG